MTDDSAADRDEFIERMLSDPAMIQRYPKRGDRKAAAERVWNQKQGRAKPRRKA